MYRKIKQIIHSVSTSDGAGVALRRSLGKSQLVRLDPFLMLDEFSSDNPNDYIAGFPSHPHRGFETVTYMLEGKMLHEDHMGNKGLLGSGDVQWMTAGRGVIHSEMPQQEAGLLRGFQLWINLPSREKMKPASYRDIKSHEIPLKTIQGGKIKLIAGVLEKEGLTGPIHGLSTDPFYADIKLSSPSSFEMKLPEDHNAFVYVVEGSITASEDDAPVKKGDLGVLETGDHVKIISTSPGTRFLLIAGKPIGEPIAQYGPFVMNTRQEIDQAIQDYQNGVLT